MSSLAGNGALVRLALRRDRVILVACIATLVVMVAAAASATVGLYPDVESRVQAGVAVNSMTSTLFMFGPIHDETSLGALSTFKMGIIGAVAVAVLCLFLVVRHTRTEEETGRLELLGATVVGRQAPLTAALIVAAGTALATGLGMTIGLIAVDLPAAGSALTGLGSACLGLAFAAVAAVTVQLVRSGRAAAGLAGGVLGASYLLRAVGDASSADGLGWLSWLSPVGWWQQTRPFAGDRWWVLAPLVALALALTALAYALAARRDFASGILPDRPGPDAAAPALRTPLALAWRLQRGTFLAWAAAFAVVGLLVGALVGNVGDFITSPEIEDFITRLGGEKLLTDAYLSFELGMAGVLASAYGVQAAMRLRSEETALRVDPVLAGATGRVTWAWSHLAVSLGGTAVLLAIVGLGTGVVAAVQAGDAGQIWRILGAALVQIPAAWLVVGIVAAAFGLAPRLIAVGWVALAGFVLLGEIGPLFELDQAVMDLSPFAHVPRLPGGHFTVAPLLWLTAIAAALVGTAVVAFRRRDVE